MLLAASLATPTHVSLCNCNATDTSQQWTLGIASGKRTAVATGDPLRCLTFDANKSLFLESCINPPLVDLFTFGGKDLPHIEYDGDGEAKQCLAVDGDAVTYRACDDGADQMFLFDDPTSTLPSHIVAVMAGPDGLCLTSGRCAKAAAPPPSPLEHALRAIVSEYARQFNVTTVSVGVKLDEDGREFSASSSADAAKVPSGSAAKPFTTVALLQLALAGKVDLDTPVAPTVDAWHAAQSPPVAPLKTIFRDPRIEEVTLRQLLGMQSGVPDYDDGALFRWTLDHPADDKLPLSYLQDAGRAPSLDFAPGGGVAYSSNGFVLAGLVLAAASGAPTWEALDQLAAIAPPVAPGEAQQHAPSLPETLFTKRGACRRYKDQGIIDQFALRSAFGAAAAPAVHRLAAALRPDGGGLGAAAGAPRAAGGGASCGARAGAMPNRAFAGGVKRLAAFAAASADECCGASATAPLAEYASVWTFEGGNCSLYYGTRHGGGPRVEPRAGAVSGWSVFPFNESDVVDLIDYSCLNGWTMGNIAFSPADAVRFWHALLVDRSLLGADGVAAMLAWKNFTGGGWNPGNGVQYGLGLMNWPLQFRVNGTCAAPGCSPGMAEWRHIGHPGMDWGSGMLTNGHVPELALSVSIATSTAHGGMNASLTRVENERFLNGLRCAVFDTLLHFRDPTFGRGRLMC